MTEQTIDQHEWPMRPWVLAALLGVAGLLVHFASGGDGPDTRDGWRAALTALFFFGPVALAFTLDRGAWKEPLAFGAIVGLVMAGLAWRAVSGAESYASPEYGFIAGLVATAIALPLFQSGFHRTRFATPYPLIHGHAWSDAIGAAGALAFTGASWLLLLVLSELFRLLKIDFLRDLMGEGWFGWAWSGVAFGAALGVLRNESKILGTLQRVVMVVMSILAVPLAAGLAVFLIAMIVSGPQVLWEATRSATPVLLLCAGGAWLLANAIVRDSDEETSGNRLLRIAALALTVAVLPLTVFAAVSLGTRIAQHGLSPERVWGLIAIAVACAYGVAWLVAVARGWRGQAWRENMRRANLHLAVTISLIALLLALPIFDFGAISARNQLARLDRGAVSADEFDYSALRWDFGGAGRRALARLEKSGNATVAKLAKEAGEETARVWRGYPVPDDVDLRVQPEDPALQRMVKAYLRANPWPCTDRCVALELARYPDGRRRVALIQSNSYIDVTLPTDKSYAEVAPAPRNVVLLPDSKIEVRTLPRRYITVDGVPVGQPLDDSRVEGAPPPR
ncbi:DUF4153 domain-containing protein [Tsuneonella sp. HG249]